MSDEIVTSCCLTAFVICRDFTFNRSMFVEREVLDTIFSQDGYYKLFIYRIDTRGIRTPNFRRGFRSFGPWHCL